jgi:LysM repeat protein
MKNYVVKTGDTLGKIARKFNVSIEGIVVMNSIADPNRIKVGQTLAIPEASTDGMTAVTPAVQPPTAPAAPRVNGEFSINRARFALAAKEFVGEVTPKDLLIIHFTAGQTARGAFDTWVANPVRVATSYIVDADGTIFETFDPSHWAFHLGVATPQERRSIGIEIANVGPLRLAPGDSKTLNWWPSDFGKKWCRLDETAKYVKSPYRGFDFYASFPEEQVQATVALTHWLCDRFGIKKTLPAASKRMTFDAAHFAGYKGVAAHHNYRPDKFDTGPAFDLDKLGF